MSAPAMRTLSVVGARPQFVKIAPVSRAIARLNSGGGARIEDVIVHTGQHYDDAMSAVFFDELRIPRPAINLEIGSGSHAEQTGRMLMGLERVVQQTRPDVVVVYGDTNSTLAATLAAAKVGVPVAHVEAGLRSFNRTMPEEINRIVADHVADVLYAPTPTGLANLGDEGLAAKSVLSGDVMLDAVTFNRTLAVASKVLAAAGLEPGGYALVTIHRAENTKEDVLLELLGSIGEIAARYWPVVLPIHPRTASVLQRSGRARPSSPRVHVVPPVPYLENLFLVAHAQLVLTDSGGLQKEAYFLGTPCITLRNETEWPETVEGGGNCVAGIERARVLHAVEDWARRLRGGRPDFTQQLRGQFGDGDASTVIVEHLALRYAR
jgi:UDP-N-acetylglucosamine 2-epimerase